MSTGGMPDSTGVKGGPRNEVGLEFWSALAAFAKDQLDAPLREVIDRGTYRRWLRNPPPTVDRALLGNLVLALSEHAHHDRARHLWLCLPADTRGALTTRHRCLLERFDERNAPSFRRSAALLDIRYCATLLALPSTELQRLVSPIEHYFFESKFHARQVFRGNSVVEVTLDLFDDPASYQHHCRPSIVYPERFSTRPTEQQKVLDFFRTIADEYNAARARATNEQLDRMIRDRLGFTLQVEGLQLLPTRLELIPTSRHLTLYYDLGPVPPSGQHEIHSAWQGALPRDPISKFSAMAFAPCTVREVRFDIPSTLSANLHTFAAVSPDDNNHFPRERDPRVVDTPPTGFVDEYKSHVLEQPPTAFYVSTGQGILYYWLDANAPLPRLYSSYPPSVLARESAQP